MSAIQPIVAVLLSCCCWADAGDFFRIKVIDEHTNRGVPLVELRTVNNIRLYTDSAGVAAFHEPGLMNSRLFFHISSHGYEYPKDRFGFAGRRIMVKAGDSVILKVRRVNVAERLYRMTGAGIYRDTVLLGDQPPTIRPLLNGRVFGSDSVVNTVYKDQVYWFWGDTNRPSYPLGNFHVPGATSELPEAGGLDPEIGVNLNYFTGEDGFAKPTAQMPGAGPTWIDGLVTLSDADGREKLFAKYVKIKPPMIVYERGLIEFDDEQLQFGTQTKIALDAPLQPVGHPLKHQVGGVEYVYFGHPFPRIRVRATAKHLRDLDSYEAFTCLKSGSGEDTPDIDRDADGSPRFSWRKDAPPVVGKLRQRLIQESKLNQDDGLIHLQDVETGKLVTAHGGSVYWNEYRKRWVAIILESFGTSVLGEIWYAEADTPLGPWVYARKIVTHEKYSFYNPKQHPMFDKDGGRTIFFEGTYTNMFSGNPDQTPRYNYNQIMYKLDLTDTRLALPVPVYDRTHTPADLRSPFVTGQSVLPRDRHGRIAWFALDRPTETTVPVYCKRSSSGAWTLQVGSQDEDAALPNVGKPAFHALPVGTDSASETTLPLFEYLHRDGNQRYYSTRPNPDSDDYERADQPVCLVWTAPVEVMNAN